MREKMKYKKFVGKCLGRTAAMVLAAMMMLTALPSAFTAEAEAAENEQRTIGILFDNSGSMYKHSDWCRALYALETFAAMAEDGDRILIYPMHAITVGVVTDEEIEAGEVTYYTSNEPLEIICGDEASVAQIREIYTPEPDETPIESLEEAYDNLMGEDGEKWFIVLTDGYEFDRDGVTLSDSKGELSELLSGFNENLNVMYLGIGSTAVEPELTGNDTYAAEVTIAKDSASVLADMVAMANTVFGRTEAELSGDTFELSAEYSDITILVQGADVSEVAFTDSEGTAVDAQVTSYALSYSTTGQGKTKSYYNSMSSDTDLVGMLVTYENVPAGEYMIFCDGSADSISVSYKESAVSGEEGSSDAESTDTEGSEAVEAAEAVTEGALTTEAMAEETQDASEAVVNEPATESTEYAGVQSKGDITPSESEDSSDNSDGLLANGHWVVLGVVIALIVFVIIWIVMHQRIFPERIMLDQTYYTVDGEEMAGEATIEGGRNLSGRVAQITVRAPEVPGRPELEFGITFEIKPVDYRCMKSFLRRVEIVDITGGTFATAQVRGGSIAASKFTWNEAEKCYVDEAHMNAADGKKFGYTVGNMRTYRLNGVAMEGDREVEVELSFVLQHK